jgi:hypothetical protein
MEARRPLHTYAKELHLRKELRSRKRDLPILAQMSSNSTTFWVMVVVVAVSSSVVEGNKKWKRRRLRLRIYAPVSFTSGDIVWTARWYRIRHIGQREDGNGGGDV